MGKLAFVFPGQGAQYVGMGKEFYEQISVSRKVYTIASEVTGLNLPGLCFEKNEQIDITEYINLVVCKPFREYIKLSKAPGQPVSWIKRRPDKNKIHNIFQDL